MSKPAPAVALGACADCGAPIAAVDAHFCNACGRPVTPMRGPRRQRRGLLVALGATAAVAVVVAVVVGSGGPSSPGAPPPPLGAAPPPAPTTPTLTPRPTPPPPSTDAPAAIEVRAVLDPAGGAVPLGAGLSLAVPPGAVAAPTALTFRVFAASPAALAGAPPGLAFEGQTAQARFEPPLELIVPLPADVTDAQAASALTGTLDRGAVVIERSVRVATVDGQRALIAPIDHFSVHVLVIVGGVLVIKGAFVAFDAIKGWIWGPPAAVAPIAIPVYHQGSSPECLATAATMVTRAIAPGAKEIWRLMAGAGLSTRGESAFWLRWSGGVRQEIERIVGVDPEVCMWQPVVGLDTGPLLGALKRYVRQQLAAGRPVLFSSTAMSMGGSSDVTHAVVLVGYDDTGYFAANPQNNSDQDAAVRHYTEAELGITWAISQSYVTLVVAKPLAATRTDLTVNVPPASVWFESIAGASAPIYAMSWDGAAPGGVRWSQHPMLSSIDRPGAAVAAVPGDVTRFFLGRPDPTGGPPLGGIEIINAAATPQPATVSLEVFDVTAGKQPVRLAGNDTELRQIVEVPGKAARRVAFVLDVMALRPPTATDRRSFQVQATVRGPGGSDTATFDVTLEPDRGKPLVGLWEGTAFGGGPMAMRITRQTGHDFEGTFELQGVTLGIAGTWDRAAGAWTLELWELGTDPPMKFPAPGSLVPYSGGRLQLTAPGGLLVKRGAPAGDGGDDPYQLVDEYLRNLPQTPPGTPAP